MAASNEQLTAVDSSFDDSASSGGGSYASSIATYIREGVEENGRKYASYGNKMYALPIDDKEQERNDIQHAKFTMIIGGKLHLAELPTTSPNILDLGTGSGIWAVEAAEKYESGSVLGVDIAAVQSSFVPRNCQFEILDIEDEWILPKNSFDFIHARELIVSVRDWPKLLKQAYEHLKPGGYLEIGGSYPHLVSDDNTISDNHPLVECEKIFAKIADAMGAPADIPTRWKGQVSTAGFTDVNETVYKVPQGVWPKDKTLKKIGAFEAYALETGLDAYLLRGYTQVLGGKAEDVEKTMEAARKELKNPKVHSYAFYYKVVARKPE